MKEGSESTLGCEGSAQRAVSRSQRERQGLRQTWRGCSTQRDGRVQGPWGDAQGVQDKQGGHESGSKVGMRGVRAEMEQEEPGVTPSYRGRGRRDD